MRLTRLLLGIALLAIGNLRLVQLFARDNVRIELEEVAAWSPLLLVAAGLVGLVRLLNARQSYRGPLLLVLFGGVLLMVTLEPLRDAWWPFGWPVLAVGVGWWLVATAARSGHLVNEDWPREVCLLDSRYVISNARRLHNGTIHAVLAGFTMDLRAADVTERGARIDVTAVLGGVDLIVPPTWDVTFDAKKLMAVCRNRTVKPAAARRGVRTVKVSALAVLGGIEVHNNT